MLLLNIVDVDFIRDILLPFHCAMGENNVESSIDVKQLWK